MKENRDIALEPVLETKKLTRFFSGIAANRDIDFQLLKGEIHAVLGENGAGKSTLMNIISGLILADSGQVFLHGKSVSYKSSRDAIASGIGMIHQQFMLIPGFTVAENIILGREITRGPFLNKQKTYDRVKALSIEYGLEVDPSMVIEDLPVGIQQRVEILKTLYRNASILILDEPTAVLAPKEIKDLFKILKQLTSKGVAVIFITHKLKEALEIADRITVIRQGIVVGSTTPSKTGEKELAELMVGRKVEVLANTRPSAVQASGSQKPVLEIKNLTVNDDAKIERVSGVFLTIKTGEIIGIAGVQGNGQRELAEALTGLRQPNQGEIRLSGEEISGKRLRPRLLVEKGMGHIPEDRIKHGLVGSFSVADNQVLCSYYKQPYANVINMKTKAIRENAHDLIKRFDIRTTGPDEPVSYLSGGNQQKVIISRELSRDLSVLIANQPSRGLDIGATEFIRRLLLKIRDRGTGIILISSDLDEILALSDRIAVMYRGKIVYSEIKRNTSKEKIGLILSGG